MELLGPLALSTLIVDYNYSLHGLEPDSDEYRQHQQLSEVHSAKRIFSLCEANKGFYVKAGQFVVALRQVPKEYSWTLSSLQDQFGLTFHACAVSCDFNTITAVLVKNLGQGLSDLFLSFDEEPIAAASIAHIHRAMLKDHEKVAIKVQYPGLEKQIKIVLVLQPCHSLQAPFLGLTGWYQNLKRECHWSLDLTRSQVLTMQVAVDIRIRP